MSIRRALACVLMVAFAAGAGLRLECLLSCGRTVASLEPSTCHASATTGEALGQGTDVCRDDGGRVVSAFARTDAPAPAAAPPAVLVPAFVLQFDRHFSSHASFPRLVSPPNAPPLPLRI